MPSIPEVAQFLKRILPADGWYALWIFETKKHLWTQSLLELSEKALAADARGSTVYHACSAFAEKGSRKSDNVRAIRSFWQDLDVDPDDPTKYPSQHEALLGMEAFRAATGFPAPIYVNSGYGVHAYWPLVEELTPALWRPRAQRLKDLMKAHGVRIDPSRAADASSVLRPVGTHNRKDPTNPREVLLASLEGPYPLEAFRQLEEPHGRHSRTDGQARTSLVRGGAVTHAQKPQGVSGAVLAAARHDGPPSDPNRVADLCAQIDNMRKTRGALSEPVWYACCGVVAWCDNGRATTHEWSTGDDRYSVVETDRKLDQVLSLTGPTTCARFSELNQICQTCILRGSVTSPVELGRTSSSEASSETSNTSASPESWRMGVGAFGYAPNGSLIFRRETQKGEATADLITSMPVYVDRISRGEYDEDSHSVTLRYKPAHEEWRDTTLPARTFFGPGGVSEVMGRGIVVHDGDLFRKFVRESLDKINATQRVKTMYQQFGWKEDNNAFLYGRTLYRQGAVEHAYGTDDLTRRARFLGPTPRGSLEKWTEAINKLFAVGYELQALTFLASCAAPLMRLMSGAEGGSILSLVSGRGGHGKSTALTAAMSVWGRHTGMKLTLQDTANSKSAVLGIMGNLPIVVDEFSSRAPDELKAWIEIFTNGRDKLRLRSDGALVNAGMEWQTILIGGSNTSVIDALYVANNGAAMATRVIEFTASLPAGVEHSRGNLLQDTLEANAGWAGDRIIRYLLQPEVREFLQPSLQRIYEEILNRYKLPSTARYKARFLAAIAVIAPVVAKLGLAQFNPDHIVSWATEQVVARILRDETGGESMTAAVVRFLDANQAGVLVVADEWRPGRAVEVRREPRAGVIARHEMANRRMMIQQRALRAWMQKEQLPWSELLAELDAKGILISENRMVTLGAGTDWTTGQTACIELNTGHEMFAGLKTPLDSRRLNDDRVVHLRSPRTPEASAPRRRGAPATPGSGSPADA